MTFICTWRLLMRGLSLLNIYFLISVLDKCLSWKRNIERLWLSELTRKLNGNSLSRNKGCFRSRKPKRRCRRSSPLRTDFINRGLMSDRRSNLWRLKWLLGIWLKIWIVGAVLFHLRGLTMVDLPITLWLGTTMALNKSMQLQLYLGNLASSKI